MKNIRFFFFLLMFWVVSELNAQNYFYAVFEGDTLQLTVSNAGSASIQWMQTTDTTGVWMPISGATGNDFDYVIPAITGEFFVRAEISDLSVCDLPYYGSILKLRGITHTYQLQMGDYFAGGLVFWTNGIGYGLVAATYDQSTGVEWGCMGNSITGASSTNNGAENTIFIYSDCATRPIAASVCSELNHNGYTDWFLPAKSQLNLLYEQRSVIDGITENYYWSSTEADANTAWNQHFFNGAQLSSNKENGDNVRCIRHFSLSLTVQQRLDLGELPKQIFDSGVVLDSLYGKTFQGGFIFHLDTNSGICYMAAPNNLAMGMWGCSGSYINGIENGLGMGEYNTTLILNSCFMPGIAASLCEQYSDGTYSDWFLPSIAELDSMRKNLYLNGAGGFSPVAYWSSSQMSFADGYSLHFGTGVQQGTGKNTQLNVRPVRRYVPMLFAGGSGTEVDPWLISNSEELNNVRYYEGPAHKNKWFRQIANIDLNIAPYNQVEGWVPIGYWDNNQYFAAHYNGSGYSISGLFINRIDWDQGLFGWTASAHIDSVTLVNVNITGDDEAGGLVAWADSSHFNECHGTGNVNGSGLIGGLFGFIDNNSTITNCHFSGDVVASSYSAGGLAGKVEYTNVTNCYSTGTVFLSGTSDAGGLLGTANFSGIYDSYSFASVQATGSGNVYNGGLIGVIYDSSYVANCFSTGNVSGAYHTGGCIGAIFSNSFITDCYSTGTVTTTHDWNGGFTSWNEGFIQNCYTTGNITGNKEIGGFVGVNAFQGVIENCYSTGNVSGNDKIGGFVGHNQNGLRIKYCYSIGTVTGNTNKGGFCGFNPAMTISNCFWDTEKSGMATSAGGNGVPTYLMVRQNNYAGWPTGSIWYFNEGVSYPFHSWQGGMQAHNDPGTFNQNYVLDIDFNLYPTVLIGTQTWMASNMRTTRYNDGNYIPVVTDAPTWAALSTPARCWYNNDSTANDVPYGQLYNYYVIQLSNVCPTGWHVPSNAEWDLLLSTLGGASAASPALRETGTIYWTNGNPGATNSSGFSAVGTGSRWYFDGTFTMKGTLSRIHSSTVFDTSNTYNYLITDESPAVSIETNDMKMGNPIRCIKD